jgi:hypothetical protein
MHKIGSPFTALTEFDTLTTFDCTRRRFDGWLEEASKTVGTAFGFSFMNSSDR